MDRYAPDSLAAEQSVLEAFLSLPLSRIDPGVNDGWAEEARQMAAPGCQQGLDKGVAFNSGI
ncbi:MAG: hypothetical protein M3Y48_00410 [Actinomycetota bacterium]|nr:hypothetical protein [Actinomycetota bacterium]